MFTDYRSVRLQEGYWKQKQDLNRNVTVQAVYDRFYETGRVAAFRFDWKEGMPDRPHFFWDSDVAKWIEGVSYILSREEDPTLQKQVEDLIDQIIQNQGEDGYFNIYFTVVEPEKRFRDRGCHELYCAGHLMEAACAYYQATGEDRFLRSMEKYADYIAKVFTVEKSAGFVTPGHEEIELALIRMYRTTGKTRFLELARFFLENRGQPGNGESQIFDIACYSQSHLPIREQRKAFGHAVRAMYLYSGMADLAAETGDAALLDACRDLFRDVTERKMYVTGGIGSTHIGEAFTAPYDLPDNSAYAETCASIGMMFFANRMLKTDPERPSKYADIVELEMYNGMMSGLSLDGEHFFYENPLEIFHAERNRIISTKDREHWPLDQRVRVFECSCCPPNINRILASLGDYFYACDEKERTVYVNQFGSSVFEHDGMRVTQKTDYPADGTVTVTSNVPVFVRVPGWCREFSADAPYEMKNGYARFAPGTVTVTFAMQPELIASNVKVVRNLFKAALRRGPIVYCAEGIDNGGDVHTLVFAREKVADARVSFSETFRAPVIDVDGFRCVASSDALYAPLDGRFEDTTIRLIPYSCFANRGASDMRVFLNYR